MSSGKSFKTAPNSAGILCPEIKKMAMKETVTIIILEYFYISISVQIFHKFCKVCTNYFASCKKLNTPIATVFVNFLMNRQVLFSNIFFHEIFLMVVARTSIHPCKIKCGDK